MSFFCGNPRVKPQCLNNKGEVRLKADLADDEIKMSGGKRRQEPRHMEVFFFLQEASVPVLFSVDDLKIKCVC